LASGTGLPLGDETLTVETAPGEGRDIRERSLTARLEQRNGGEVSYNFPYGERVPVKLADGNYLFRFIGSKEAAVAGLRVVRDRGAALLYLACALFSLGVVITIFIRYDELWVFVRRGKAYVAAPPDRYDGAFGRSLERWAAKFRERFP